MNELILEENWWKQHWKWVTLSIILFSILAIFISTFSNPISDIAKVYANPSIYENALEKAKQNKEVIETLGILEPIDRMAIIEGSVMYSNNDKTADITIRVKGTKGKGKMDISANKVNESWEYKKVAIRIKDPKTTIQIIQ